MPAEAGRFQAAPVIHDPWRIDGPHRVANYEFCAGLRDSALPALPSPSGKDAMVKFLRASFPYCGGVIPGLGEEALTKPHNSPDGAPARAGNPAAMYIHTAHHRGQAEVYLRDKGIRPT
jgi:hypothetical protein